MTYSSGTALILDDEPEMTPEARERARRSRAAVYARRDRNDEIVARIQALMLAALDTIEAASDKDDRYTALHHLSILAEAMKSAGSY